MDKGCVKNKRLLIFTLLIIIVIATMVSAYYSISNKYIASVASEKISRSEYRFFLSLIKKKLIKEANFPSETAFEVLIKNNMENMVFTALKEFKIQVIKAKENNIRLDSDDIKKVDDKIKLMVTEKNGIEKVKTEIASTHGVSLKEYTFIMKEYLLIEKFKEEKKKSVKVSEDEVRRFFEENKSDYEEVSDKYISFSIPEQKAREAVFEMVKDDVEKQLINKSFEETYSKQLIEWMNDPKYNLLKK